MSSHGTAEMSCRNRLPMVMGALIGIFDEYAKADGNKETLTKAELKTLLENDMTPMIQKVKESGSVDELLKTWDLNGDDEVDFDEFLVMVCALTRVCRECMKKK